MGLLQKLPRLDYCCCCIDLRSGAIILGVLGVFGTGMSLFKAITYLIYPDALKEAFIEQRRSSTLEDNDEDITATLKIMSGILVGLVIFYFINLFVQLLLLIGALKRNLKMLSIYLHLNLLWMGILMVLAFIVVVALLFVQPSSIILAIIGFGIGFGISLYYLFCINSYYLLLEDEQHRGAGGAYLFKA